MRRLFALVFLSVALILSACRNKEVCPGQWRPTGGSSACDDWQARSIAQSDKILWRVNVGAGHSSASVCGHQLYTMGQVVDISGADTLYSGVLHCLDTRTGESVWDYRYPSEEQPWPGPGSTPVVSGKRLFALNRAGVLFCLERHQGVLLWKRNLAADSLSQPPNASHGYHSSVLVMGDRVIVNAGEHGLCLSSQDGSVVWSSPPGPAGQASPVAMPDGETVMINGSKMLSLVALADGAVLWQQPSNAYLDPLVLGNGRVFTATAQKVQCLEIDGANTEVVWETSEIDPVTFLNFVTMGNRIFGFTKKGRRQWLVALDSDWGTVLWKQETVLWGAVLGAGQRGILVDGNGTVSVFAAGAAGYEPEVLHSVLNLTDWQEAIKTIKHDLAEACWTAPVIHEKKLYIRSNHGNLVCIDLS